MEVMKRDKKVGRCMSLSDEKMEINEGENNSEEGLGLEMIRGIGSVNVSEKS